MKSLGVLGKIKHNPSSLGSDLLCELLLKIALIGPDVSV